LVPLLFFFPVADNPWISFSLEKNCKESFPSPSFSPVDNSGLMSSFPLQLIVVEFPLPCRRRIRLPFSPFSNFWRPPDVLFFSPFPGIEKEWAGMAYHLSFFPAIWFARTALSFSSSFCKTLNLHCGCDASGPVSPFPSLCLRLQGNCQTSLFSSRTAFFPRSSSESFFAQSVLFFLVFPSAPSRVLAFFSRQTCFSRGGVFFFFFWFWWGGGFFFFPITVKNGPFP